MSNLVQCLRCKQSFIREEYDEHVCASNHIKGVKDIEVLQWWETKSEYGERVAFGLGSDGYTYKMREVKEGFIELDPINRKFTVNKSTADYTEPYSIKFIRYPYRTIR